jgi:hypothetical protein
MVEEDTREDRRIELVAAVILGIAGILTAYAAYSAALADGDALTSYTASARSTADANGYFNEAVATYGSDRSLFLEYQLLVEQGELDLALAIRERLFSPELEAGTVAWELIPAGSPDVPATPLDTEAYVLQAQVEAIALTEQAADEFAEAQDVGEAGDKFELAAVFLAMSLFLAGIGSLFKDRRVQVGVLAMSVVVMVPGVMAILQGRAAL